MATATGAGAETLTVKVTPAYKAWVGRAARHARMSKSALIDLALTTFIGQIGFQEPAPPRLGDGGEDADR